MTPSEFPPPPFEWKETCRHFELDDCLEYMQSYGSALFGSKFKIDRNDQRIFLKLIAYAIKDYDEMKKYSLSPEKGILLTGPIGCGKTSFMQIIQPFLFRNERFKVHSATEIASTYAITGHETIVSLGRKTHAICIDDLGIEPNQKHFGSDSNVIGEIMLMRYDLFVTQGILTHATTNLNAGELEAKYGNRVRSRLRSMFNLISFPANTQDKRR